MSTTLPMGAGSAPGVQRLSLPGDHGSGVQAGERIRIHVTVESDQTKSSIHPHDCLAGSASCLIRPTRYRHRARFGAGA